ncbi:Fur-regulated basic protein FbpA [Peribacillus butanolivorans]|uniref:Fur-regulated basic protein FbpA n=1 Tax=Peribacillus butanolivorans TaxID=421767 RepID=UPI003684FE28
MGKLLRDAINNKKVILINKLIKEGIYKKNNTHLFEMTLSDLQEEYNKISDKKNEHLKH